MIRLTVVTILMLIGDLIAALPVMWTFQILHSHGIIPAELDYWATVGVLVLLTFAALVTAAAGELAKAILD